MPPTIEPEIVAALRGLSDQWTRTTAGERASFQPWLIHFCAALGVPAPGSPPSDDDQFERPVGVIDRDDGTEGTNFIDYWKAGHVAIEAKRTNTKGTNDAALRRAYGQVRSYVASIGSLPPYLIVVDVPGTLIIWDRWNGSFGDFAAGRRIALGTLDERPDDIALLRDVFTNPSAFDGAKREHVERHLETLALMGEVTKDQDGRYAASRKAA